MTPPIPPADEAELSRAIRNAYAAYVDAEIEAGHKRMYPRTSFEEGFLAGMSAARTTHPPAQQAADPETECALAVGRYVYARLEAIFDAKADTPQGRELQYLAAIIADVEEYGATGEETGATRGAEVFGSFQ
jgi:hypothetical protein